MASIKVIEVKKQQVKDLSKKLKSAQAIVLTDYRGLTVEEDTSLRTDLRQAGIEYRVIKNNITRHAMQANGIEGIDDFLKGPTAIAISNDDPIAPAKILSKYAKIIDSYEIKVGILDGQVVGLDEISSLANLPSREELIAKMLGGFNAPIAGLVYVLNANIKGLAVAINAIAEKKQLEG